MSWSGKGGSSCVFSTIGKYAYDNQVSIEVKKSRSGQVVRVVMTHLVAQANSLAASDADYDQGGSVGLGDFGEFVLAFGSGGEEHCHFEAEDPDGPLTGNCSVGLDDFGFFVSRFGTPPGPSGTTDGTTACP